MPAPASNPKEAFFFQHSQFETLPTEPTQSSVSTNNSGKQQLRSKRWRSKNKMSKTDPQEVQIENFL